MHASSFSRKKKKMRKIIKNFGLILSLGFLAAGCATMLGEDSEILTVRASNDATFQARLSDGTIFKVPGDVEIVKINSHRVRIHVDNAVCLPTTTVDRQINGVFMWNILGVTSSSGLPSSPALDYLTGKMWSYRDNVVIRCNLN